MLETYGIWRVTTSGDCDGRTKKELGIFEGHIDDIALHLKKQAIYVLYFSEFNPEVIPIGSYNNSGNVIVGLRIGGKAVSIEQATEMFKDRPVTISESGFYRTFGLNSKETEETKRAKALAKLSDEERKILGVLIEYA